MTQWLKNQKIPRNIIAPSSTEMGVESREVNVTGIGTVKACPNCKRAGPIDIMTLGDGTTWPNMVVVCGRTGDIGCGLFWSLASHIPHDLTLIESI